MRYIVIGNIMKSCERSDRRTDGRKERKRKAEYHVAGWHQDKWDIWNDQS